jgi:hypothetical protein
MHLNLMLTKVNAKAATGGTIVLKEKPANQDSCI